jgi:undecaprenyl-diphosphatase
MQQQPTTFVRRYLGRLPLRMVLLLLLFIGAIALFAKITHDVIWEQEQAFDESVFAWVADWRNPGLTEFMKAVTFCASATFLQIGYAVLVVIYLFRKNWKRVGEIAAVGLGGRVLNYSMKLFFQRPRPPEPLVGPLDTFSYPSGHATSGFLFYGLLAYLVWKTGLPKALRLVLVSLLLAFALLIGFSRVYLRVHYPSDVIAGFCIGVAWLLLTITLFGRLKKRADRETTGREDSPRTAG